MYYAITPAFKGVRPDGGKSVRRRSLCATLLYPEIQPSPLELGLMMKSSHIKLAQLSDITHGPIIHTTLWSRIPRQSPVHLDVVCQRLRYDYRILQRKLEPREYGATSPNDHPFCPPVPTRITQVVNTSPTIIQMVIRDCMQSHDVVHGEDTAI